MNIQLRFLIKAVEDRNFISFNYEGKAYKKVKPQKLIDEKILHTDRGTFEFANIKKLLVLKDRF